MVLSKFFKAFVTGGLVAVGASLSLGVSVHSIEEAKHVLVVLAFAFLSGAVHAIWSMLFPTVPASV